MKKNILKALRDAVIVLLVVFLIVVVISASLKDRVKAKRFSYEMGKSSVMLFFAAWVISYFARDFKLRKKKKQEEESSKD